MLPTSLAFGWLLWRQYGGRLILICGILLTGAILAAVVPSQNVSIVIRDSILAGLSFAVLFLSLCLLPVFIQGAEDADLLAGQSCVSPQLFRLPVSTFALIQWPILYATVTALVTYVCFAWFIARPLLAVTNEVAPIWWPALLLTAGLAWLQALLWFPFGLRWLRVILVLIVATSLMILVPFLVHEGVSEKMLVAFLSGVTGIAWGVSYIGVAYARRGDALNWEWLPWQRNGSVGITPRGQPAFRSEPRAQFWIEWRFTGLILPIIMGMFLILILWPLFLENIAISVTLSSLRSAVIIPVLFAGVGGGWLGHSHNRWSKDRTGMMDALATLPRSSADMIGDFLKAAACSTLLTWGIVAAIVPLTVLMTGRLRDLEFWWQYQWVVHPAPLQLFAASVALLILLIVWTWKRRVDCAYLGLTGRKGIAGIAWLWLGGSFFIALPLDFIEAHPEAWAMIPWLLGSLVFVRFLAAVWALTESPAAAPGATKNDRALAHRLVFSGGDIDCRLGLVSAGAIGAAALCCAWCIIGYADGPPGRDAAGAGLESASIAELRKQPGELNDLLTRLLTQRGSPWEIKSCLRHPARSAGPFGDAIVWGYSSASPFCLAVRSRLLC